MIYQILVAVILIANAISDWKTRTVYDIPVILLLIVGIALSEHPIICLISVIVFLLADPEKQRKIGLGDIETFVLIYTATGYETAMISVITLISTLLWYLKTKNNSIPLASFLAIGYMINIFI